MALIGFKQWARRLSAARRTRANAPSDGEPVAYPAELETAWYGHGDHWHNLLASPLDARHYVMEDWTAAAPPDNFGPSAPPDPKRRLRWYEQ